MHFRTYTERSTLISLIIKHNTFKKMHRKRHADRVRAIRPRPFWVRNPSFSGQPVITAHNVTIDYGPTLILTILLPESPVTMYFFLSSFCKYNKTIYKYLLNKYTPLLTLWTLERWSLIWVKNTIMLIYNVYIFCDYKSGNQVMFWLRLEFRKKFYLMNISILNWFMVQIMSFYNSIRVKLHN